MQIFSSLQLSCSSKGVMKRWPFYFHPCWSPDHSNTLREGTHSEVLANTPEHRGMLQAYKLLFIDAFHVTSVALCNVQSRQKPLLWVRNWGSEGWNILHKLIQVGKWQLGCASGAQSLAHALFITCLFDGFNCPFSVLSSFSVYKKKREHAFLKPLGEVTAVSKGGNRENEWKENRHVAPTGFLKNVFSDKMAHCIKRLFYESNQLSLLSSLFHLLGTKPLKEIQSNTFN